MHGDTSAADLQAAIDAAVAMEKQRIVQMIRHRANYCASIAGSFSKFGSRWSMWQAEANSMSEIADAITRSTS